MEHIEVNIKPVTDMIQHADNVEWADRMEAWKNDPKNKGASKPGDDRTPAWRWIGCLNFDDFKTGIITIPAEYIMKSLMGGAAEMLTGKGQKTFKAQSQSGVICETFHWPLLVNGKPIQMKSVTELMKSDNFSDQVEGARALGFSLFIKRVSIGKNKHIRVRPRFTGWSTGGRMTIVDRAITIDKLASMFEIAGRAKGIGDWRPGAKTPGSFGMYTATVTKV